MHFTEYDLRNAAYAWIVDDRDRVLLTWWNGEGRFDPAWSLPGGGIDFDEAIRDGLVREVHEETGYDIEVGDFITDHFFTRRREGQKPFRAQRFVFHARIVGGELGTLEVGGSTDYAEWVPLAEVPAQPARAEIVDVALAAHRAGRRDA
ncbi:NUDIX hydrolase [Nocardioides okcheonensis]|uniref:NUDIX hydrolase n=1 Tax=Nocardioides okcheonensis TaxID=2894081 RepID=UPI001E56B2A6|nr:NUDIX hydrolase [Nocardioides okcheonensis]UFN45513.1 NUDIX hydrolase [Nocardioides okcheonensis]